MPLLEPNTPPSAPTPPAPTAEQITQQGKQQARRIEKAPRQILERLIRDWTETFDLMWADAPAGIVAARLEGLGTKGGELLQRSSALVTFLLTELDVEDPALVSAINARLATLPALTVAEDGTLTLA